MRIKIPQGVTKEDKLVGPLTLKQFLYVLGGASVIFIAYQYYARAFLYFTE
ncbi:MAG: PrgI family protein, partial [Nanoarchaeota archaeon]|nr:PrgI family protein [Nanoarchaeota archaeon]